MAFQVFDYLPNVCLTPEQIEQEEFQRDFEAFTSIMTSEDWTKINQCLDILQNQSETHTDVTDQSDTHTEVTDQIQQRGIKRKRSCSESSSTSTLTTSSTSQSDSSSTSKKKPRAKICGLKLQILEETFLSTQFVVGKERRLLADRLGLTDSQVGNWFEYRRRKMRQAQNRASKELLNEATSFVHVDLSSMVKQEQFDSFPSTSPVFNATSTSSTAWTWEDSVFMSEETDVNSTFSDPAMSAESQLSSASEDTSSWTGSSEGNDEFFDPCSLENGFSLFPISV